MLVSYQEVDLSNDTRPTFRMILIQLFKPNFSNDTHPTFQRPSNASLSPRRFYLDSLESAYAMDYCQRTQRAYTSRNRMHLIISCTWSIPNSKWRGTICSTTTSMAQANSAVLKSENFLMVEVVRLVGQMFRLRNKIRLVKGIFERKMKELML